MPTFTAAEIDHLRERMAATWARLSPDYRVPNQILGNKRTIGCVALEITQRCNFDCSICYLSENSESTPDVSMECIFSRIDRIRKDYGVGTNVQITGGDPTMRDHDELEQIVRYVADQKMTPALFTNGDLATRPLLQRLAKAGLVDVAFHVDLTEKRKGYKSEVQLCEVRQEYIERARGLGLNVIFNQTVFAHNFDEVPELIRFYKRNADVVGMASFQLQADTGRGANRKRKQTISIDTVSKQIEEGLGTSMSWDSVRVGSPKCHKMAYSAILDRNGSAQAVDMLDDPSLVGELLTAFDDVYLDRHQPAKAARTAVRTIVTKKMLGRTLRHLGKHVRRNWRPLLAGGGEVRKLSVFMQNFQDASNLDHERIDNCSFHCMTDDGGVSMCVHNAYRDHYLQGGCGYPPHYRELRQRDGFDADQPGPLKEAAAAK
jgi:molybdenum cofactor biosynthesis enzyme MoaA